MYKHIAKVDQLGSNNDQCYVQNRAVSNRVIKRSRCISCLHFVEVTLSLAAAGDIGPSNVSL